MKITKIEWGCIIIVTICLILTLFQCYSEYIQNKSIPNEYSIINNDAFDRVCRELLDDTSYTFNNERGLQEEFKCRSSNKIIIIKKYAHLNEELGE